MRIRKVYNHGKHYSQKPIYRQINFKLGPLWVTGKTVCENQWDRPLSLFKISNRDDFMTEDSRTGLDEPTLKGLNDAGATRVAMRTGTSQTGTVYYLLGDHLGSLAITATSTGSKYAETRYYPWGTERYNYGTSQTTYHFTGQRLESTIGLYYYGARWYDPVLGRFIQPDTLIPQQQGVQAWDRYAYTNNNPVKYTDPTGHKMVCDSEDPDCNQEARRENINCTTWLCYRNEILEGYGWEIKGKWNNQELKLLYNTVRKIDNYIDTSGGNGQEWIKGNLGNTIFYRRLDADITNWILGGVPGSVPWKHGINLSQGFDEYTIVHELGHRWDNTSNKGVCPATWCGGGVADKLVSYVGGDPKGLRWKNGTSGIPVEHRWSQSVNAGYGNTATAQYFAESFAWLIIDQTKLPPANILEWMNIEFLK